MSNIEMREKIRPIKLLLMDVDGVLTDGGITIDNNGVEAKTFHVRDGHGIKLLQRAGIKVGIITGRKSEVVKHRAAELGIEILYQGMKVKMDAYSEILADEGLKDDEVAYIGDDIVDLPVLNRAGFSVAVADASESLKPFVDHVTVLGGGRGAVREVVELVLKGQGLWDDIMKRYI
ncbi:MAG: HAD-IIIA family hydrolase [bacterium]|nr:HAD-IIIA family hydrolase [bacterium]